MMSETTKLTRQNAIRTLPDQIDAPKAPKRTQTSKSLRNHKPIGTSEDEQTIPLKTAPKYRSIIIWKNPSKRREYHIRTTANLLERQGALSKDERKWLYTLHDVDKKAYNRLGKLLTVPKWWRPSQRGVWSLAGRNFIRMQTLKAAAAEGLAASREKGKQFDAESVGDVVDYATNVRKALTRKIPGQDPRLYLQITKGTLRSPRRLYELHDYYLSNKDLAGALKWPRDFDRDIKDDKNVAKAAQALIDNTLLNTKAALNLRIILKNEPKIVNELMTLEPNNPPTAKDRQKVRSLVLMHLSYYADVSETRKFKKGLLEGAPTIASDKGVDHGEKTPTYQTIRNLSPDTKFRQRTRENEISRKDWFSYLNLEERRDIPAVLSVGRANDDSNVIDKPSGNQHTHVKSNANATVVAGDNDEKYDLKFEDEDDLNTLNTGAIHNTHIKDEANAGAIVGDNKKNDDFKIEEEPVLKKPNAGATQNTNVDDEAKSDISPENQNDNANSGGDENNVLRMHKPSTHRQNEHLLLEPETEQPYGGADSREPNPKDGIRLRDTQPAIR